jgi:hypothetical protein
MGPYRTKLPKPKWSGKYILVVEPSIFRRDETYVLGPVSRFWGYVKARLIVWNHPYSFVQVLPENSTVYLGERILWKPH